MALCLKKFSESEQQEVKMVVCAYNENKGGKKCRAFLIWPYLSWQLGFGG